MSRKCCKKYNILVFPSHDIALLDRLAFVVFLLAFTGGNDKFNIASAAEKLDGYELESFLLGAGELGELLLRNEKLDITGSVGAESEIIEPEFVITDRDEAAFKLNMMIADEANFRTRKHHTASELVA